MRVQAGSRQDFGIQEVGPQPLLLGNCRQEKSLSKARLSSAKLMRSRLAAYSGRGLYSAGCTCRPPSTSPIVSKVTVSLMHICTHSRLLEVSQMMIFPNSARTNEDRQCCRHVTGNPTSRTVLQQLSGTRTLRHSSVKGAEVHKGLTAYNRLYDTSSQGVGCRACLRSCYRATVLLIAIHA